MSASPVRLIISVSFKQYLPPKFHFVLSILIVIVSQNWSFFFLLHRSLENSEQQTFTVFLEDLTEVLFNPHISFVLK